MQDYTYIYAGYILTQWITDAVINDARRIMIKMQEDFFNNILPLILLQGFKRVIQGLQVRGSWRPNIDCNILTLKVMTVTLCLSRSLMLNRRPRAHCWMLCDGFLYCILSASSLDPKLHQGFRGPPRSGVAFLTTSLSNCLELYWQLLWLVELNWII